MPPSMVTPLDDLSPGGLPQVVLPTGHTAVHLTAYPDVQKILTDTSFIRSDTNVDDGPSFLPTVMPEEMLLNRDHPHHGRLKRFVAAAYSANTMAAFAPTVRRIVSDAADALTPASSFDLMTDLLEPLTINVNATYLGVPDDDIPGFRHLSRQMQLAHDTDIPQLLEDFWELYHYLEDLIAGRRPSTTDSSRTCSPPARKQPRRSPTVSTQLCFSDRWSAATRMCCRNSQRSSSWPCHTTSSGS